MQRLQLTGEITESYLKLWTAINHSLYTTGNKSKPKLKFKNWENTKSTLITFQDCNKGIPLTGKVIWSLQKKNLVKYKIISSSLYTLPFILALRYLFNNTYHQEHVKIHHGQKLFCSINIKLSIFWVSCATKGMKYLIFFLISCLKSLSKTFVLWWYLIVYHIYFITT